MCVRARWVGWVEGARELVGAQEASREDGCAAVRRWSQPVRDRDTGQARVVPVVPVLAYKGGTERARSCSPSLEKPPPPPLSAPPLAPLPPCRHSGAGPHRPHRPGARVWSGYSLPVQRGWRQAHVSWQQACVGCRPLAAGQRELGGAGLGCWAGMGLLQGGFKGAPMGFHWWRGRAIRAGRRLV